MNTAQLLKQISAGQEEALLEFYRKYANLVFSMALQVLQDRQESEEVTQDVFLTIWQRAADYDPARGAVTTWLLTITRRRAIDRRRRRQSRPPAAADINLPDLAIPALTGTAADLDLQKALSSLPDDQRQCIDLIYFGGLTQNEVAEQLDVALGTVKGRVRLAMEKLRHALIILTMWK